MTTVSCNPATMFVHCNDRPACCRSLNVSCGHNWYDTARTACLMERSETFRVVCVAESGGTGG